TVAVVETFALPSFGAVITYGRVPLIRRDEGSLVVELGTFRVDEDQVAHPRLAHPGGVVDVDAHIAHRCATSLLAIRLEVLRALGIELDEVLRACGALCEVGALQLPHALEAGVHVEVARRAIELHSGVVPLGETGIIATIIQWNVSALRFISTLPSSSSTRGQESDLSSIDSVAPCSVGAFGETASSGEVPQAASRRDAIAGSARERSWRCTSLPFMG